MTVVGPFSTTTECWVGRWIVATGSVTTRVQGCIIVEARGTLTVMVQATMRKSNHISRGFIRKNRMVEGVA